MASVGTGIKMDLEKVTVGDFVVKFAASESLIASLMKALGGDLTTQAAVVLAIPQATMEKSLAKVKQPDDESEELTPIQQGTVALFLKKVRDSMEPQSEEVEKAKHDVDPNKAVNNEGVKIKISDVVDQMDENQFVEPSDSERAVYRSNYMQDGHGRRTSFEAHADGCPAGRVAP